MKSMKKLMFALAAALVLAPVVGLAADEAAPAAAQAKPKKKLALKWPPWPQLAKAKAEAAKNEVPILVLVIIDGDEKSGLVKKYLVGNKMFKKFATENFTTLLLKGKKAAKGNDIDLASFKDREFVEKFIMDNEAKDATPAKAEYYPAAFFVTADGEKKLAHLAKYNPELGFGAWAMDMTAKLEQAGITANIAPELKKAIEDPQPDIKQKPAKGKKK